MLLIAIPKSASTSLASTIGKIGNINIKYGIKAVPIDLDCDEFTEMQHYHNNMVERSPLFVKQTIFGNKTLFKEHLLPTDRHLKILEKVNGNIAILLRNPEDVLDCYKRLDKEHYRKTKKHIDFKKLDIELKLFHDRYMWWASNKRKAIVIYYEDLILCYNNTIKKILRHYNIKGKIIPLEKKKYTGIGVERVINRNA